MSVAQRRKPGCSGKPITLADGREWLFPSPRFVAGRGDIVRPRIDTAFDECFDCSVLGRRVPWNRIFEIARGLLQENYFLTDDEIETLFRLPHGKVAETFAHTILEICFGVEEPPKRYTDWIRASLLANGLGGVEIHGDDLIHVLAILVATGRTVELSKFADACLDSEEIAKLKAICDVI